MRKEHHNTTLAKPCSTQQNLRERYISESNTPNVYTKLHAYIHTYINNQYNIALILYIHKQPIQYTTYPLLNKWIDQLWLAQSWKSHQIELPISLTNEEFPKHILQTKQHNNRQDKYIMRGARARVGIGRRYIGTHRITPYTYNTTIQSLHLFNWVTILIYSYTHILIYSYTLTYTHILWDILIY